MTQRAVFARGGLALAVAAAVLLLPGCSEQQDAAADNATADAAAPGDKTLVATIADAQGFSIASEALKEAGLAEVFEGAAAYTVLLPNDAAFDKLGEAGKELRTADQRPALAAILRDHVVPGYLTPDDIAKAIAADSDHSVAMRTMGDHTLTFTSDGGTITVANEDGAKTRFAGEALRASNGVAIPLDGVLKQVSAPE